MEYHTRIVPTEDAHTLAKLYQALIERPVRHNERYLKWRLNDPRCPFPRYVSVAYHGTQAVGMRTALVWKWVAKDGNTYWIPHVNDLVIHPAHRNRGLFVPIMNTLEAGLKTAGYSTIIGISGGRETQRLQAGMGWKAIQPLNILTLGSDSQEIQSKAKPLRMRTFGLYNTLSRRWRVDPLDTAMRKTRHATIAQCISRAGGQLTGVSTGEFLNAAELPVGYADVDIWRIRDRASYSWTLANPTRQQVILKWSDGHREVYFILSWRLRHPFYIHISDAHFSDSDAFGVALETLCSNLSVPLQILEQSLTEKQLATVRHLGFDNRLDPFSESSRYKFQVKHIGGNGAENNRLEHLLLQSRIHLLEMFSN